MNILHVIPYFTPKRGGDVNVCYNLSKQLVKHGHKVTIVSTDFEFDEEYAKSLKGIQVIPFRSIANIGLFLISPSMRKWLKRNIKNFDVIHLHEFRSYQSCIVHYYAKNNIPYVIQAHGSVLPFFQKQRLKRAYDGVWGNKILKDATKVIALTKIEAEQYKKMGVDKDKIELIPNGIDISEYTNMPKRGEFRKKYSIRADEKLVLYLGRIHKIKGIDLLVKAFADLLKELDTVRLVIVGPDDGFLSTLKRQIDDLKIADKILFTGPLYERDKLMAYVDADVYVLPSVYEIFGITVLEACACGMPVIVTSLCGIADIVDKVGCVVEYDKNQLRKAIFKILSDDELRMQFGKEGRKLVGGRFTWDKIVGGLERIYADIIREQHES